MEQVIKSYIQEKYAPSDILTDTTSLFSSGMIDSFGVLELIVFLEETYGIQIDTMENQISDFDSISKIVALVLAKQKKLS